MNTGTTIIFLTAAVYFLSSYVKLMYQGFHKNKILHANRYTDL